MTNPPPEPTGRPHLLVRLLRIARRPSTIVAATTLIAVGITGYGGLQYFISQQLSPLLSSELSKTLGREVQIGKVESFSLNHIRFGSSAIPPTAQDPGYLSLKTVDIGFNPLPLLVGQPLPLEVTLTVPRLYLQQDKTGQWFYLKLPEKKAGEELPIDIEAKIRLERAEIALKPQGISQPFTLEAEGNGRYLKQDKQQVAYDLNVSLLESEVKLQGETTIETGKSQVDLTVKNLALAELGALIPQKQGTVKVKTGQLDSNLTLNLPAWDKIEALQGQGNLSLTKLEGTVKPLSQPLKASFQLGLEGQKVVIERGKVSLGKLSTDIQGKIGWQEGYDLLLAVSPLPVPELLKTFKVSLPVKVTGEVQSRLRLKGPFSKPSVTGTLNSSKPLQVDRVQIKQLSANFQADLDKFTFKQLKIIPATGGQIIGQGKIKTGLKQVIEQKKAIDWQKMPIAFNWEGQVAPKSLLTPYYSLPSQVSLGSLTTQGQIRGTLGKPQVSLQWQLPKAQTTGTLPITGRGEVWLIGQDLLLRQAILETRRGQIDLKGRANLGSKEWQASLTANSFPLTPFLPQFCPEFPSKIQKSPFCSQPISLEKASAQLSGRLDSWQLASLSGTADLGLKVAGGRVAVRSRFGEGEIVGTASASQIALNPLLPDLSLPLQLARSQVNFAGPVAGFYRQGTLNLEGFRGEGSLQLLVGDRTPLTSEFRLQNSQLNAFTTVDRLSLTELLPQLPISASLVSTEVYLSANLPSFLASWGGTPDLSSLSVTADTRLAVAGGTVKATALVKGDRWQADINAANLDLKNLKNLNSQNIDLIAQNSQLNAQLNLSGSLASLFAGNPSLNVQAKTLAVQLGEQTLTGKGNFVLANLSTAPDLTSLNLEIQANTDLKNFPLTAFLDKLPVERDLLPEELKLTGKAQFAGRITGKNVLTAPTTPGNVRLAGNLQLTNLTFNDRTFESVLSGPVKADLGGEIALDLRGKEDIIRAAFTPCLRPQCPTPYLPVAFELRQTAGQQTPLIAQGRREGEHLLAEVKGFPLELFKIRPGKAYDLPGVLTGTVSATADLNLFTGQGKGTFQVAKPKIGFLEAEAIAASLAYQDSTLRLSATTLELGKSQYMVAGLLNLKTGEVQGQLEVEKGRLQDLIAALKISDLQSLRDRLQGQELPTVKADSIPAVAVGNPASPLSAQLNLLTEIDRQIRTLADQRLTGGVPTSLNFDGTFQAQIALTGTLLDPKVNFQLQGKNWLWYPQTAFPNIVEPLGLVMEEGEFVSINEVALQGSLEGGLLQVQTARLQIKDAVVSLQGKFSLEQSAAQWRVENLSLDNIRDFIAIPADLTGQLDGSGTLAGSFKNPQIVGKFAFTQAAFNARLLNLDLKGDLLYANSRLTLQTTAPDSLSFYASVPYPNPPDGNNLAQVNLEIGTAAIALLGPLTRDQFVWQEGKGEVKFQAKGRVDWEESRLYGIEANGQIVLQDARLKSAVLPDPVTVNGQIAFNPQKLKVERLEGRFAKSKFSAIGTLPIFKPLPSNDPDRTQPLTVAIAKGKLDLAGVYRGALDAQVTVTGTAFSPAVGGEVRLSNGQVFIPSSSGGTNGSSSLNQPPSPFKRLVQASQGQLPIAPKLDNFQVVLQGLSIEQMPLYRFTFGGALTLNGPLANLNDLQPNGQIRLEQGIFNFLDTRFLLNRRRDNQIAFTPAQGLLNPNLNIQMRTILSEVPEARRRRYRESNEIPDDSLNKVQRLDINLGLDGSLRQLMPSLGEENGQNCQISPYRPLITDKIGFSAPELQRLARCLQNFAATGKADEQLLGNPVVKLTSSPPRSEGQIVQLLADQVLVLAEGLQSGNTEQLVRFGIVQLGLGMAFQGILYDVENTISNTIGAADFYLVPFLEPAYQVEKNSFIRFRYDYSFNEVRIQYERRF